MSLFRKCFYMLLGFSFPFFWGFHMEGFADLLYRPIQLITATKSTMWPSFITASLGYGGLIVLIERLCRRKSAPGDEWDSHRHPTFLDHEVFLQEISPPNNNELTHAPKSPVDRTDQSSVAGSGD